LYKKIVFGKEAEDVTMKDITCGHTPHPLAKVTTLFNYFSHSFQSILLNYSRSLSLKTITDLEKQQSVCYMKPRDHRFSTH
jgi:hypothetical protein